MLAAISVLIIIVLAGCSFNIGPLSVDISRRNRISRELNEKQLNPGCNGFNNNNCCKNFKNFKEFKNFKDFKNTEDIPYLGIYMAQGKDFSGALVADVIAGSPADKAGIKVQDIITIFDGKTVKNPQELLAAVMSHTAGDNVKLTVTRDGQNVELTVTLGSLKDSIQNNQGDENNNPQAPETGNKDSKTY